MAQPNRDERQQPLQDEVSALGGLVEEILIGSADLLRQSNLEALERLGDDLRQIHRKRLSIEMGCLSLIATRRPRGGELRSLVATVEIATELERIADHARRMARVNYLVADPQLGRSLASIQRLARTVQSSLNQGLEAFVQQDLLAAQRVLSESRTVYELHEQVHQHLLLVMQSRPGIANQALYLSRAAYNLRRAAERVAGVCEWVVFFLTGAMRRAPQAQALATRDAESATGEGLLP
jgi:phosphate transport system protein